MGLTDPLYLEPYVDVDEWRDVPVRHRYVHGGFADTGCRFSMYFPDAKRYQGRFFHPVTPVPGTEHAVTGGLYVGYIEFSVASGAYLVESNLGLTRRALPGEDSTIAGYRASAAVAMYSRCWQRRCTANTDPTAMCSGAAVALTGRWRASRTTPVSGTARCRTSTGRR